MEIYGKNGNLWQKLQVKIFECKFSSKTESQNLGKKSKFLSQIGNQNL